MLALSKESGTFSEKIERAAKSGLTLAGASEEVQKRAATSLLVLADGVGTIDAYTEALDDAAGSTREMAEIQLDTLGNQLVIVKSAWEGLILEMLATEENLNGIKASLGGIILLLNAMTLKSSGAFVELERQSAITGAAIGQAFGSAKLTRELNELVRSMEKGNESVEEFFGFFKKGAIKDAFSGLGKDLWQQLFPTASADEVIEDLEDVEKLLKGLFHDTFTEEDQGAIMPDFGESYVSDETKERSKKDLEELLDLKEQKRQEDVANAKAAQDEITRIEEEAAARRKAIFGASFEAAGQIADTFANLFEAAKQKELSAAGDNAEKRLEIEKEYAKKQQAIAIAQALINTAEAITKTATSLPFPLSVPFIAALTASMAGQIALIKNQKFAKGEVDITGPLHSSGGIQAEIEGGESVINRRATAKHKSLLEAINSDDQIRIANAAGKERGLIIRGGADPYTRKLYELMRSKETYGEDNNYFYKHKGNMTFRVRKK